MIWLGLAAGGLLLVALGVFAYGAAKFMDDDADDDCDTCGHVTPWLRAHCAHPQCPKVKQR